MTELTFTPVDDEFTRYMSTNCHGRAPGEGFVMATPSQCILNTSYPNNVDKVLEFQVFPDDVWIVTFPKCGTTWTQEMVWLLMNDLNYEVATTTLQGDRSPYFEFQLTGKAFKSEVFSKSTSIDRTQRLARPRCIKSHLPFQLLPRQLWTVKPKIIYMLRDPRDVAGSFHHHHLVINDYNGTCDGFMKAFLADRVSYAPFWGHVLNFWKMREEPNILINTYEDMKEDLMGTVMKTCTFLGKSYTNVQLQQLCQHLSFDQMQGNKSVNKTDFMESLRKHYNKDNDGLLFMRRGQSGGWRKELSVELQGEFERWNRKHLSTVGLDNYEQFIKTL